MISCIVLCLNEAACIEQVLQDLHKQEYGQPYELLLADGGSTDGTQELARPYARIVNCERGKARQMNQAAAEAKGDILFFVHADMHLSPSTFSAIHACIYEHGYDGGGFANEFDTHNQKIKQLGTLMNLRLLDKREQSDKGIFYGDNGIFVRRTVFEQLGGFREIPIMEDYDFSLRMKQHFRVLRIASPKIVVSARRHIKAGFVKTRLQWVLIRKLYQWGVSPAFLAKWYRDIR